MRGEGEADRGSGDVGRHWALATMRRVGGGPGVAGRESASCISSGSSAGRVGGVSELQLLPLSSLSGIGLMSRRLDHPAPNSGASTADRILCTMLSRQNRTRNASRKPGSCQAPLMQYLRMAMTMNQNERATSSRQEDHGLHLRCRATRTAGDGGPRRRLQRYARPRGVFAAARSCAALPCLAWTTLRISDFLSCELLNKSHALSCVKEFQIGALGGLTEIL